MMTTKQIKAALEAGHTICNVGQWSKSAAAWVSRAYRAGKLVRMMDYDYPSPRPRYWLAQEASV